ncbi:MAG: hypothetical protein B6D72_10365 [gamma proteobacterium symbiont of Ctena orbiculata]|nr:MAG: hypothetical protein DBP00_02295 [gamma proteobacterium symbiont of Ctena orbiculata]PVV11416.1 MAG: hypothetical protein B6D72_10365 [gamma proteobacterium symbiont of Ctena orbiculata]PVV25747.1 MAG: hypothetical protein B6D74_02645 [gamma proteobacterium symbiont of Ctena orbiculata]
MKTLILICSILITCTTAAYAETGLEVKEIDQAATNQVIMIGASYLQGWPLKNIGCLPVVNKGVNGETSTQVRARFDADVISAKPAAVLIWGHINDFSNAPMAQELQTRQTAIDNLKQMIESAREAGIIPLVATEITFGMPTDIKSRIMQLIGSIMGKRSYQDYISSNVLAINEWLRDYAEAQEISILEIERLMTNAEGNRKQGYYTEDLSHITEQAYQDLQSFAQPILQKALIEKHGLCN